MSIPTPINPHAPAEATVSPFGGRAECSSDACAKDRIFAAARKLFYQQGIRGVSVDAIAAEAGTTKVTLYRVFASKDDLLVQVLEDHSRRFWRWWDATVAPHAGDPRKQIEVLFESVQVCACAEDAERGCPVANSAVEVVEEDHPARRIILEHNAKISERLRTLCRELGARRPEQLADALTVLMAGVFAARLLFPHARPIGAVAEAAKALLDSPVMGAPDERKAGEKKTDGKKRKSAVA
ncbi:MAG TPA: TetR/AcrR family transcriptional regulator [Gammaproteobacteria bacterium]